MKVTLISHTPDALNLLLKTKNTRLSFDSDPSTWTDEQRAEHLEYMRDTIKSSWEMVDYIFEISDVTRVFTHQLVRTRTGSYAQQAMRVVDARDFDVLMPTTVVEEGLIGLWGEAELHMRHAYGHLIDKGVPAQDARGLLPNNVLTNIMAKFNLRTLHDMAKLRLCTRTQGEYQEVFREMRRLVLEVHPWAEGFMEVHCVATGTCAFPRYGKTECPVYLPAMDNTAVREEAKKIFWETRHEAAPVAKEGRAM
jgi:flavin-dependent thymidylate synthase